MSGAKYEDWILETIDQLRKRKARPGLERICYMLERKHGVSLAETEADLEKLVDAEIVIKVNYKGSTSYRNAAKWRKSHLGGHVLNSNDASRKLQRAVRALTGKQSGDSERRGASLRHIERWLNDQGCQPPSKGKNYLQVLLNREVEAGRIEKLPSGNYAFVPQPKPSTSSGATGGKNKSAPGRVASPSKKGRPATKRKRFKKASAPDTETPEPAKKPAPEKEEKKEKKEEEVIEKKKEKEETEEPATEEPMEEDKCDYCLLTASSNSKGQPEELLICKDCMARAHPSCMDYSDDLAQRARNSPWQCIDCKTCYVCEDSGDPEAMLFCDACDKGYHMGCHNPPIKEKPTGKWVCSKCMLELGIDEDSLMEVDDWPAKDSSDTQNTDGGGPSCLPTPSDSPVQFDGAAAEAESEDVDRPPEPQPVAEKVDTNKEKDKEVKKEKENEKPKKETSKTNGSIAVTLPRLADTLQGVVPDASNWTIEEVVQFFLDMGFLEQAEVFREQEIDGRSLLLLKRSDVLTGLSLKLGPALKIYTHVQQLQLRGQPVP